MSRRAASVAFAALVFLAACSTKTNSTEPPAPAPTFTTIASGTLTIGSDIPYAPFEFNDEKAGGKLTGFDVELFEAVAAKLTVTPKWVDAVFDTIFANLDAGKFDVVVSAVTAYAPAGSPASKTVEERLKVVSFTTAYYDSLQSLTVDKTKTPNLTSTDGLKSGDKVAVQTGTTGESWAKANLESKGVVLVGFEKAPQMFQALESARVKGVVNDFPVSLDAVKGKANLKVVQQISTGEQYGFAVNKRNTALIAAINKALDTLFKDGTYSALFKKYFPEQQLPSFAK